MEYYDTYTSQLYTAMNGMKVKDECVLFIFIGKDVINNINVENFNPLAIFSMNKKDVYLMSSNNIKEEFYKDNKNLVKLIENKINDILTTSNTKYNKWIEIKNQEDISKLKSTFDIIYDICFGSCWKASNDPSWFEHCCYIIYGPIMMILLIIFYIVFFPLCNIYDCCCGRYTALISLVQKELSTGNYVYTNVIDNEILNNIKSIVSEVNVLSSDMDIKTGSLKWQYVCKHFDTDNDYDVNHNADIFYFQISLKPSHNNNNNDDVVLEVITTDNIQVNNNGNYNSIPVEDV